ncbi:MAG: ComF family protein [Chitinispirillia bacterium]|nr:ComF family protein [Chitinispirillia bacterium]
MEQATVTPPRKRAAKKPGNKALSAKPFLSIFRRVEDFLIPPLCIVCNKPLAHVQTAGGRGQNVNDKPSADNTHQPVNNKTDRWFCTSCIDSLSANHATRSACPRCAVNRSKRECACEFAWDFPFERIFSIYDYDDTLSVIARHIKYKGKSQLAYHTGAISAKFIPDDFWAGIDFLIPVPLHKSRMRKRGYNQAEHFARGLSEARPIPLIRTDLLTRTRNTGTQTKLDREGRLENLIGAFAVNPRNLDNITGKNIILVDDILTTGATTEACTDELLRAGCASVRVLSLGRD